MEIGRKCKAENDIYTLTKKKFPKFQILCVSKVQKYLFFLLLLKCDKSNKIVSISKWMVVSAMSHNDNPCFFF